MSTPKPVKGPNVDLVTAARTHSDQILKFCDQLDEADPVIVFDFQKLKLHSYAFDEYKATLRPDSQAKLNAEYDRAVAKKKVLVVVWDSATRRLATARLRRP
jgi:hypothetical protein